VGTGGADLGPVAGVRAVTPYWASDDGRIVLHQGDCREVLAGLPPESVSACVTSPPFFGLRSYECEPTIWGGDPLCSHILRVGDKSGLEGGKSSERAAKSAQASAINSATCALCGAWCGQYGSEPSVSMYVEHTIEVLRAIRRVLRPDGVLWWDLDDSRVSMNRSSRKESPGVGATQARERIPMAVKWRAGGGSNFEWETIEGLKPKSLCLIPQRVAIAAQEDGWVIRSQIVIAAWTPESARDRPTDSYRVLLMLTKAPRYWFDGFAVRVATSTKFEQATRGNHRRPYLEARGGLGVLTDGEVYSSGSPDGLRWLGNLWTDIPPAAHPSSPSFRHFAVMPLQEAQRAILASVPEAICTKCGKARARVVKRAKADPHTRREDQERKLQGPGFEYVEGLGGQRHQDWLDAHPPETIGWTACGCGAPFEPGTVLDCFAGTGTTLLAAQKLHRRSIGIELSEDYCRQAVTRLTVGDRGIRRLAAAENDDARQEALW